MAIIVFFILMIILYTVLFECYCKGRCNSNPDDSNEYSSTDNDYDFDDSQERCCCCCCCCCYYPEENKGEEKEDDDKENPFEKSMYARTLNMHTLRTI